MSTVKVSVTLDDRMLAEIKSRVGARGLSRFINETLVRRLQQERLSALQAQVEQEHGTIPELLLDEARAELAPLLGADER